MAKNAVVKVAFKLLSSCVFEKFSRKDVLGLLHDNVTCDLEIGLSNRFSLFFLAAVFGLACKPQTYVQSSLLFLQKITFANMSNKMISVT